MSDRLARNSMDGGKIVYLLDTGKLVDLKFPTFWFENTPQGKFMLSIAFGQSKYYVDNLSENVKRGLRQKLRNGVWPAKAPYGYLNNPKTRGIDIDPEKSKAIKRAFETFAEGNHTFTDMAIYLHKFDLRRKNGKPLHINEIRQILSNKFYIGIMFYNGEYHDGNHKCFVSKELYQKVQEEMQRRSKHFKKSYRFPFLGLARCSECGAAITAEQHIKFYKTTNRKVTYVYYRCTKKLGPCSQTPITNFEMEEQLSKISKLIFKTLTESKTHFWTAISIVSLTPIGSSRQNIKRALWHSVRAVAHGVPPTRRTLSLFWSGITELNCCRTAPSRAFYR